jgi:hypothetical protein
MSVGQISRRALRIEDGQSKAAPTVRIRLLSSIGLYPRGKIHGQRGTYHLDEQLSFIAVRTHEKRAVKYHSDLTLLGFEEIRFLSAILLSIRPDHGVLRIYPGLARIIDEPENAERLYEQAKTFASEMATDRFSPAIPMFGGAPYEISGQTINDERFKKLVTKISIRDHLMLRGLSAILKADMLKAHREFEEEAQSILYIAMEAAYQLTSRLLRERGNSNPSSLDAGEFLFLAFPNEVPGMRFFEEYYEDRIKTFHPENRFGAFAFPPMTASDAYGLRAALIAMFQFLITKERWYTLWD